MIASCNCKPNPTILQLLALSAFFCSLQLCFPHFLFLLSTGHLLLAAWPPCRALELGSYRGLLLSKMSPVTDILPTYMGFAISSPNGAWRMPLVEGNLGEPTELIKKTFIIVSLTGSWKIDSQLTVLISLLCIELLLGKNSDFSFNALILFFLPMCHILDLHNEIWNHVQR